MKFLANMGISPRTVDFLRARGHEAIHLHEQGLDRMSDSEILQKAVAESAVLLTSDLDFSDLAFENQMAYPSIVIFRLHPPMRSKKVNEYLQRILDNHQADLERGVIISVNEKQIRMRRLPL